MTTFEGSRPRVKRRRVPQVSPGATSPEKRPGLKSRPYVAAEEAIAEEAIGGEERSLGASGSLTQLVVHRAGPVEDHDYVG